MSLTIGCPHPDYLTEYLTPRQLDEWLAYYRLEPFGHRVDHQMLAQQSVISAMAGGGRDVKVSDFMPEVRRNDDGENEVSWELAFPGVTGFSEQLKSNPAN